MAAATFEELKKQIEARVKKALVEDVAEVVKENESDTIERVVYGVYSDPPVVYKRRRGNGGLSDPENMRVRELDNAIEVYNDTPPNYVYNGHEIKCPNCSGELVWDYYDEQEYGKINYCPYCGQRINVVDTEDDEEESHE